MHFRPIPLLFRRAKKDYTVRMKKWDYCIIGLAATLSLLPLIPPARGDAAARVTVTVGGETVYAGLLSDNATVPAGRGNVVTIENGHARMTRADCPDGLCLNGEATGAHPLICLPNGVVVTVETEEEALDGLSY